MVATTALLIAAIVGAVASAGAGVYSTVKNKQAVDETNALNKEINETNNAFNAEQAAIQRQWEESMSNTSIQRRMADLKAAGLNPSLAVTSGAASTPGAFAATSSGNAQMKAMDYASPLGQMSANLGHLVNSAARIEYLNKLSRNDPRTMSQLGKMANNITRSTMSADKMDDMAQLDAKYGDLIRNTNLWR